MQGLNGWYSRLVCKVILGGESNRLHIVVCWVAVLRRWCEMERNCKRCCFCLLVLVIPEGNAILPIVNRMVDARCVATTGGRRLFCM
jgi:hypothetical protein